MQNGGIFFICKKCIDRSWGGPGESDGFGVEARWGTDVFLEEAAGSAKEEKDMARGWRSLESSGGGNAVCDRGGVGANRGEFHEENEAVPEESRWEEYSYGAWESGVKESNAGKRRGKAVRGNPAPAQEAKSIGHNWPKLSG